MAEDNTGTPGGGYRRQTFEEKYPGFTQGEPEQGWDPQSYGYSDDMVLVRQGYQVGFESAGLVIHDMIIEDDNEIYYVMGQPLTADDPIPAQVPGHWWTPYVEKFENWRVDLHSYDWGSLIPGLDFLSDTLDVAGKTVTLERKGRLLHANINTGFTSKDLYYQFPDVGALDSFLDIIGQDVGEQYY